MDSAGLPQKLSEVRMHDRLLAGGAASIAAVGKFFGWDGVLVISPDEFSADMLAKHGWTREKLTELAEGYEHVSRITPDNTSAVTRAIQLREIADNLEWEN